MSGGEFVFTDLGGWISGPCLDESQLLDAAYPESTIRRVEAGGGLTAHRVTGERLQAATRAGLEEQIIATECGRAFVECRRPVSGPGLSRPLTAADRLAEAAMDVIDQAVAEGKLPG